MIPPHASASVVRQRAAIPDMVDAASPWPPVSSAEGTRCYHPTRAVASAFIALLMAGLATDTAVAAESPAASIPIPSPTEILSTLKKEHPRLLLSKAGFDSLRARVALDPRLKEWHTKLKEEAERILPQPPSKYEIPDGLRLLSTSRRVLQRTQTLALLHRLDGDARFADRAWKELDAAAAFTNWNPRHFLDTAEMTHAFAVGYDWLYDHWTPAQRDD